MLSLPPICSTIDKEQHYYYDTAPSDVLGLVIQNTQKIAADTVAPRCPGRSKSRTDHPEQRNIRDSEMADEKTI